MAELKARLYMDTICSHSWNARININRLRQEYRDILVDFDYIVYPLFVAGEFNFDTAKRWWLYSHWGEVSEYGGEPIANSMPLENPITDSSTGGEAYLAARRQGTPAAHRYLERLQLGVMAQRQRISDEIVLHRLAEQSGLDADRLMADLAEVKAAREMEQVTLAARAKGVRSRPTLVLSNAEGREYWVIGPQPYAEFVKAVEVLQAGAAAPPLTKVGGRILGYNDLAKVSAEAAPSGAQFAVTVSDGRPEAPRAATEAAIRLVRVESRLTEDLLGTLWRTGLDLITVYGRAAGISPQPFSLLGVRAIGAGAPAAADARLGLLMHALDRAGVKAVPATEQERDWLLGMSRQAAAPAILQFLPGRPRTTAPLLELPGDFALITLADAIAEPRVQAKAKELAEAQELYLSRLSQPEYHPQAQALVESFELRREHHRRWAGSGKAGMWRTFAYLLAAGDPEATRAGADSLRRIYFDREHVTPVSVQPYQIDLTAHMHEHLQTFTLCNERWLHGADWWNTPLTGSELSRYMPGLFAGQSEGGSKRCRT